MNQSISFPAVMAERIFISKKEALDFIPPFEDERAYTQALLDRDQGVPTSAYPRESSPALFDAEARVAELIGLEVQPLLYNTGMAAVHDAIDVGLSEAWTEGKPQVVAYSDKPFKSTKRHLEQRIKRRGVQIVEFDSGDTDSVEAVIERYKPDVVLAETVGNGLNTPLLDTDHLLNVVANNTPGSTVVLDNTLPSSATLPLNDILAVNKNVIGVESGTKFYAYNNEFAGIAFTSNENFEKLLRTYRCDGGTPLIGASVEKFVESLPASAAAFKEYNQKVLMSAATLAQWMYEAEQEGANFSVSHPSLPSHANYEFANSHYPDGISPVLFLACKEGVEKKELSRVLRTDPAVAGRLALRPSFGFEGSCIIPNEVANGVRITGGADIDSEALGQALKEAALRK